MATKISDISTNLMTGAWNAMKESKAGKAEAAFQSFLNQAVSGNGSKDNLERLQSLQADSGKIDYAKKDNSDVSSNETAVNNSQTDKSATEQSTDTVASEKASKLTEPETADKILDEVSEELGIGKDELLEQMEELMSSIAALLMEKFNVTEDELYQVLDMLGLSLTDMFNQSDLMNVAVELTGAQDIAAVLTDEKLYVQIQEAFAELEQMKDDVSLVQAIDTEQLQLLETHIETVVKADNAELEEPAVHEKIAFETELEEPVTTKQEPVMEVISEKQKEGNLAQHQEQTMTGNEAFQQFTGRLAQYTEQVMDVRGNEFAQQADMEEIIRQVTDYVKVQVDAETTSLEMQLHPESYGKLNLQVSVREGVVTAKLAVENEMVRQALETQIVQLREDMNERGLKVDAVEVAIASHEFESNLEEGQENSKESSENEASGKRQINLREEAMSLAELAEMSEAEALTRKIMLENGNSIDFSA